MPRRPAFLLVVLALTACTGKADDTATPLEECGITVSPLYPTDGQTDVYARSPLDLQLSAADPTAVIGVKDTNGNPIAGTTSFDETGTLVTFTPMAPLAPVTAYTLTLSFCTGEVSIGFTTSDLGSPLASTLEGRTWAVDPASGRFVQPPGAGDLLGGLLGGNVLLSVLQEGATLDMRGALSAVGSNDQDTCNRTVDLPSIDFSESPYFELPEGDVTLNIAGSDITIGGMHMTGTFAADGTWFGGGTLSGDWTPATSTR